MADSENKPQDKKLPEPEDKVQAVPKDPPESITDTSEGVTIIPPKAQDTPKRPPNSTALEIIRTKEGTTREIIRSGTGRFVKKPRPLIPAIEFTRRERKALAAVRKDGLSEYEHMFMTMLRLAQYEAAPGEKPDPKILMAKCKASEWIRLSALGKPASSEQDLERITNNPVKTIMVVAPQLMNPDIQQEKPAVSSKTKPSFIDAEFIDDPPRD